MTKPVVDVNNKHEGETEPSATQPNTETDSILIFSVGPVELCVYMQSIQSVQDMQALSTIPTSAAHIMGGFWHQEKYVPVVNTRFKFGLPEQDDTNPGSLITTYVDDELFAFRVDKIIGVTTAKSYQWQKLPPLGTGIFRHALTSQTEKDDKIKLEVDLKNLKDAPYLNVKSLLPFLSNTSPTIKSASNKATVRTDGALISKNNATTNKTNQQKTVVPNTDSTAPVTQPPAENVEIKENISSKNNTKTNSENNNKTTKSFPENSTETFVPTPISATTLTGTVHRNSSEKNTTIITYDSTKHTSNNNEKNIPEAIVNKKTLKTNTVNDEPTTKPTNAINSEKNSNDNTSNKHSTSGNNIHADSTLPATNIDESETSTITINTNDQKPNITQTSDSSIFIPILLIIALAVGITAYEFFPENNTKTTEQSTTKPDNRIRVINKSSARHKITKSSKLSPAEKIKPGQTKETESTPDIRTTKIKTLQHATLQSENTETTTTEPAIVAANSATRETEKTVAPQRIIIDLTDHEIIIERSSTIVTDSTGATTTKTTTENTDAPPNKQKQPLPSTQVMKPTSTQTRTKNNYNLPKNILFQHTVVKGDTLWHIAKTYLGNPYKYPELANLSGINNPDLIYPGDVVKMKKKQKTSDW